MGINNPAGRLHAILAKGKAKPLDVSASKTLAELLEVDEDDFVTLLKRLGLVYLLPSAIRQSIEKIDDFNPQIHLEWVSAVELAFKKLRLQRPWGEFINLLDGEHLLSLKICDHELSKHNKVNVNAEEIDVLKSEAESIRKQIVESNIAPEVARYLLGNLDIIDQSFDDYQLSGPESVRDAVQITIGSIAGNVNIYEKSNESEAGQTFWTFVRKLALILEIIAATVAIGGFVSTLSLEPSEITPEEHQEDLEPHSRAVFRNDSDETDHMSP